MPNVCRVVNIKSNRCAKVKEKIHEYCKGAAEMDDLAHKMLKFQRMCESKKQKYNVYIRKKKQDCAKRRQKRKQNDTKMNQILHGFFCGFKTCWN